MTSELTTPQRPLAARGEAVILKGSYVALSVDPASLGALSTELETILGEDFEELKANRDSRDGASSYHMTAIEPREFRKLAKELKGSGQRLELPSGPLALELIGIGTAESESSQAWFAVCRSESVAAWRKALGLPAKDLHITLAFGAEGDVHGAPKGIDSLITTDSTTPKS